MRGLYLRWNFTDPCESGIFVALAYMNRDNIARLKLWNNNTKRGLILNHYYRQGLYVI